MQALLGNLKSSRDLIMPRISNVLQSKKILNDSEPRAGILLYQREWVQKVY